MHFNLLLGEALRSVHCNNGCEVVCAGGGGAGKFNIPHSAAHDAQRHANVRVNDGSGRCDLDDRARNQGTQRHGLAPLADMVVVFRDWRPMLTPVAAASARRRNTSHQCSAMPRLPVRSRFSRCCPLFS